MSMVTTGAETWAAHTHRHHAGGTAWIFGPEGPTQTTGPDPVTAMPTIGSAQFLFWNAAGAQGGGLAYPAGELTPTPTPVFPAGTDPGSVIAWYVETGGPPNGGPPGLYFDALLETEGNWIDWDATNDPFTVGNGVRGPQPDDDDEAYTDTGAAAVSAQQFFPGTGLIFDQWLVFGDHTHVSPTDRWTVTQDSDTSGIAFAVYKHPSAVHVPRTPVEGPVRWFDRGDPAPRIQQILREQSELGQIASLIDYSAVIADAHTRSLVQHGMYEALIATAQAQLNAGAKTTEGELAVH
jgi:hypothetical protein